jgi:hypothetical protein
VFGFKKSIPAPDHERAILVREMFLHRAETDPMMKFGSLLTGISPTEMSPEELLMGSPESTILRVVEQYLQLRDRKFTHEFSIKTLNLGHTAILSGIGAELEQIPRDATLFQYTRFITTVFHGPGAMTDDAIIDSIERVRHFYKRPE